MARAQVGRSEDDVRSLVRWKRSEPVSHRDRDWPRYPETILRFSTEPPLEIDLRELPSADALSRLRAAGFGEPFAVITAFDPRGRNLSEPENEERKLDLDRRLGKSRYRFVKVDA